MEMYIRELQRDANARLRSPYTDSLWDQAQQQAARLRRQFADDVSQLQIDREQFRTTEQDRARRLSELEQQKLAFETAATPGPADPQVDPAPGDPATPAPASRVPQSLLDEIAQVRVAMEEARKHRRGRQRAIENRRDAWTARAEEIWHATRAETAIYWAANAEHHLNFGAAIGAAPKWEPDLPDWTKQEYTDEE